MRYYYTGVIKLEYHGKVVDWRRYTSKGHKDGLIERYKQLQLKDPFTVVIIPTLYPVRRIFREKRLTLHHGGKKMLSSGAIRYICKNWKRDGIDSLMERYNATRSLINYVIKSTK